MLMLVYKIVLNLTENNHEMKKEKISVFEIFTKLNDDLKKKFTETISMVFE